MRAVTVSCVAEASREVASPGPSTCTAPLRGMGSISAQDAVQGGWQGFGGPSCTALLPISCLHLAELCQWLCWCQDFTLAGTSP